MINDDHPYAVLVRHLNPVESAVFSEVFYPQVDYLSRMNPTAKNPPPKKLFPVEVLPMSWSYCQIF